MLKNIVIPAVFLFFLLAFAVDADEFRTWTSATGKFTIEAEYVGISKDEKNVTIRKKDGEVRDVPLDKLSTADQEYVTRQKAAANQPKIIEKPGTPNTPQRPANRSVGQKPRAVPPNQSPQAAEQEKALLRKKIDFVNRNDNTSLKVELSEEEKEAVVQYLLLAEKVFKETESEAGLSLIMWRLGDYKKGNHDFFLASLFGRAVTNAKIKYDVIDTYVVCLAARSAADKVSGKLAEGSINARAERDRYATKTLAQKSAGASAAASSARSAGNIIESLLPECNRLSGNVHDEEEKERLGKKQLEAERKQLFGK